MPKVLLSHFRQASAITISLVLVVILGGCANRPQWPDDTLPAVTGNAGTSGTELNQRLVLDQIPFYAQELYQCGPASLAMMLNSQGLTTQPDELKDLVYLPGREGSLQVELVAAARSHGMVVYPLDGTLKSLLTEVAAGNPVMVMQNLAFDWWPQWHFAVVMGFDDAERNIILHTSTHEAREDAVETFFATWSRTDNWAVVMLPPEQLPATAEPLDYLTAVNDLETTGNSQTALRAYETAEKNWPDQPAAVMGQGNLAYQRGDWAAATDHYLRLTDRFPELAAGWNNLAHALAQSGCESGSQQAAQCAHQRQPERFSPTLDLKAEGRSERCPAISCPAAVSTP
ncbi:MAG: PA2778 family cysteine peptidase [Oleiphilaceae bacterium]|nr:PA2778 family cysteine peptidase [Oleiphilaceae bacterium]